MPTPPRLGRASKCRLQNDKRVSSRPARNRARTRFVWDCRMDRRLHGRATHTDHMDARGFEPCLPRPRGACKPCCNSDEREVTQCVVQRLRIVVNFGPSWRGSTSLGASLVVGLLCLCANEVAFFCNAKCEAHVRACSMNMDKCVYVDSHFFLRAHVRKLRHDFRCLRDTVSYQILIYVCVDCVSKS